MGKLTSGIKFQLCRNEICFHDLSSLINNESGEKKVVCPKCSYINFSENNRIL
jgi:hypothetical protein